MHAAYVREVLIGGDEPRRGARNLLQAALEVTVRAENQVDPRHGAGKGEVVVEVLVTDHHHGVDMVLLA